MVQQIDGMMERGNGTTSANSKKNLVKRGGVFCQKYKFVNEKMFKKARISNSKDEAIVWALEIALLGTHMLRPRRSRCKKKKRACSEWGVMPLNKGG